MYDVIIIGGGTAGCACAWNSAKLGLKTLLVEKNNYLGGTMTGGLVIPVMNCGKNQINTDFYTNLIFEMKSKNAQITYQGNAGWFNPFVLKNVLFNMLKDAGVKILLNTELNNVITNNNNIYSIKIPASKFLSVCTYKRYFCSSKRKSTKFEINNASIYTHKISSNKVILSEYSDMIHTHKPYKFLNNLSVCIKARYYVDSTGDLNFCDKINCNFLENKSELPPVSLRFIMSGIDLKKFGNQLLELDSNRDVTTVEEIDNCTHLSTAYTWDSGKHWALAPLFDDSVNRNILKDSDRNYFQVFTIAGMPDSLAFNCPRIIENIDPLNLGDIRRAYNLGKSAIERISNFCKICFKGFENAFVSHIADCVGVRASRRLKGKYIYTIDDLKSGKRFEHPAVISNYPVDVHTKSKNTSKLEEYGEYQLPIESLMSVDYENLYTAGRGLSADELAQGALRVQLSCFSMGEAVAKDIYQRTKH